MYSPVLQERNTNRPAIFIDKFYHILLISEETVINHVRKIMKANFPSN